MNLFNAFNRSFQVRVQADADARRRITDIRNLSVANRDGQMVPLGALLNVDRTLGSELITRYNLYPAAILIGVLQPKFSSGQATSYPISHSRWFNEFTTSRDRRAPPSAEAGLE